MKKFVTPLFTVAAILSTIACMKLHLDSFLVDNFIQLFLKTFIFFSFFFVNQELILKRNHCFLLFSTVHLKQLSEMILTVYNKMYFREYLSLVN